ncbi:MAG: hypothetical protein FWE45_03645 [Firmicutes bacterium]|nr:hypothetical protein [Bacillota bacterium]
MILNHKYGMGTITQVKENFFGPNTGFGYIVKCENGYTHAFAEEDLALFGKKKSRIELSNRGNEQKRLKEPLA